MRNPLSSALRIAKIDTQCCRTVRLSQLRHGGSPRSGPGAAGHVRQDPSAEAQPVGGVVGWFASPWAGGPKSSPAPLSSRDGGACRISVAKSVTLQVEVCALFGSLMNRSGSRLAKMARDVPGSLVVRPDLTFN